MQTLANLPVELPKAIVPEFIDLKSLGRHFREVLNDIRAEHFVDNAIWRDFFALTGTLRTFYTPQSIATAWKETASVHSPSSFIIEGEPRLIRAGSVAWVEISFTFETKGVPGAIDYGYISVVPEPDGKWRIWILRTILEQLQSLPDVDVLQPTTNEPNGAKTNGTTNGINGPVSNGTSENGATTTQGRPLDKEGPFDVAIIGGGQAGLSVGGRLKPLGVSYVIQEKFEHVGDNWKTRYDSTKLHTIREFAHLPFERTFPASYPEFLIKDDLVKGYQAWASKYDINIWLSTTVTSDSWDEEKNIWTLELLRNGQKSSLSVPFVVFAVGGNSQFPIGPAYANKEAFCGIALHSTIANQ